MALVLPAALVDGWYGFRVLDGSECVGHPGAKAGVPCLVARKRMNAPFPDVEVVLPLDRWTCARWKDGGFGAVALDVFPRLNEAVRKLLDRDEPAVLV